MLAFFLISFLEDNSVITFMYRKLNSVSSLVVSSLVFAFFWPFLAGQGESQILDPTHCLPSDGGSQRIGCCNWSDSFRSTLVFCVKATVVCVYLCTSCPSLAFLLWCSREPPSVTQGKQEDQLLSGVYVMGYYPCWAFLFSMDIVMYWAWSKTGGFLMGMSP